MGDPVEGHLSALMEPPVPLVALVGRPDLHASIGGFLQTQHKPAIQSIGIADPHSAPGALGQQLRALSSPQLAHPAAEFVLGAAALPAQVQRRACQATPPSLPASSRRVAPLPGPAACTSAALHRR